MKKIVFIGGYGNSDVGDDSHLTADLINLKRFLPDAQFLALSDNPEYTLKRHRVKTDFSIKHYLSIQPHLSRIEKLLKLIFRSTVLLFNARRLRKNKKPIFLSDDGKRFLENLKDADLLFNVGGGNINSIRRLGSLYDKFLTYVLCRTFRVPIILSGQTIGPFYGRFHKRLANFALNGVNVITLREKFSKTVLEQIGVTKPLIKVTADDSTLLPPASLKRVKEVFLKEKITRYHPLIGINMIKLPIFISTKLKKAKRLLAEIADYLISRYDARIVFVPMQYIRVADDRIAASEVLKLMKHKDKARIIMHEYDDRTIKSVIGQMDLAIGLRYHFIVFAVNSQVPSIGIYLNDYYSMKIRGILDLMGQEKYACGIEEISIKDLINLVEDVLSNKEAIRKKLEERTKELGKLSLFSIKCATKLLSQNQRVTHKLG